MAKELAPETKQKNVMTSTYIVLGAIVLIGIVLITHKILTKNSTVKSTSGHVIHFANFDTDYYLEQHKLFRAEGREEMESINSNLGQAIQAMAQTNQNYGKQISNLISKPIVTNYIHPKEAKPDENKINRPLSF